MRRQFHLFRPCLSFCSCSSSCSRRLRSSSIFWLNFECSFRVCAVRRWSIVLFCHQWSHYFINYLLLLVTYERIFIHQVIRQWKEQNRKQRERWTGREKKTVVLSGSISLRGNEIWRFICEQSMQYYYLINALIPFLFKRYDGSEWLFV